MKFKKFMALICTFVIMFSNLINVSAASDDVVKAVLLGDSEVGKTTMFERLQSGEFNDHVSPTIGAAYVNTKYGNNELQLWDTNGRKDYRHLLMMYCRGVSIVVICIDCANPNFDEWVEYTKNDCPENILICAVVTKTDTGNTADKLARITEKAKEHHIEELCFVSAKTGEGIEDLRKMLSNATNRVVAARDETARAAAARAAAARVWQLEYGC
ncbi:MAG: GTP-binding protein [Oscillospiraceae bacterium]|jgi:small GTP-binding protein|nr:GTP-binding protein [Oscillospiraceae bacterium]